MKFPQPGAAGLQEGHRCRIPKGWCKRGSVEACKRLFGAVGLLLALCGPASLRERNVKQVLQAIITQGRGDAVNDKKEQGS
jgi:hypothetical protein